MAQAPLHYGILWRDEPLAPAQARCLEQLLAVPGAQAVVVLVQPAAPPMLPWLLDRPASAAVAPPEALAPVPRLQLDGPPEVATLQAVAALDLAFVLALDTASVPAALAAVPRWGVWAFAYGDVLPRYRDVPTFREVMTQACLTRLALVRLSGAGTVLTPLYEGQQRTIQNAVWLNVERCRRLAAAWPARACRELLAGAGDLPAAGAPFAAPVAGGPSAAELLRYQLQRAARRLTRPLRRLVRADWNVGVVERPVADMLAHPLRSEEIRWLELPPGESLADPFGLEADGKRYLLAERLRAGDSTGHEVACELTPAGVGPRSVLFPSPHHMSYPYLFRDGEAVYCLPESSQVRTTWLYRATHLPTEWQRVGAVLPGHAVADSTLFRHDGRWWLLCTDCDADSFTQLLLFWADDLPGEWHPHPQNPVKTDVRGSRTAGPPFRHNGQLYRPSQDCASRYGAAVVIQRVERLTLSEFAEVPVARIEPDPAGPYPDALHHLCGVGQWTLLDGRRLRFHWPLHRRRAAAAVPTPEPSPRRGARVVMIGRDPLAFPLARSEQLCDLYQALAVGWDRLDVVGTSELAAGHTEQCGNITIHAGPRATGRWRHLRFLAYAVPRLRALERTLQPDVYWASNPFDGGVAALSVARRGRGALLLDVQGDLYRLSRERFGLLRRGVMAALTTWLARRAERVRVLSRDMQAQLARRGVAAGRIAVVPARADFALFDPERWAEAGQALRATWGWPDELVVLYVGAMTATKGPDLLLRAAARLSHGARLRLVLVGDGPLLADLRPLSASLGLGGRVQFAGRVDYHQVPAWYAAADAVCVPSRDEGMGRGAIQGAAMALPAVVTAVGGNREMFAGGVTGWLVPPTVDGLAAGLTALARLSPQARQALGRKSRHAARASFEMVANTARLQGELVGELLRTCPRRDLAGGSGHVG